MMTKTTSVDYYWYVRTLNLMNHPNKFNKSLQRIRKLYYKTLRTSVINIPMSPPSLRTYNVKACCLENNQSFSLSKRVHRQNKNISILFSKTFSFATNAIFKSRRYFPYLVFSVKRKLNHLVILFSIFVL